MFESISIRNFQAHKKLDIELDEGVNVIVGPSDAGKTAIIRALRWLVFNEPAGDAFRSSWGGRTSVTIKTEEGDVLRRVRTDKANYYTLNKEQFKSFGRGVPDEIRNTLRLDRLNFLFQGDPAFLLSKTPGQVAKELNNIANLDIIDHAISTVSGQVRETQSNIRANDSQIEYLEETLTRYDGLDKLDMKMAKAESHQKRVQGLHSKAAQLYQATQYLQEQETLLRSARKKFPNALEALVDTALKQYHTLETCRKQIQELHLASLRITDLEEEIANHKKRIASAEEELHTALEGAPCPLCGRVSK